MWFGVQRIQSMGVFDFTKVLRVVRMVEGEGGNFLGGNVV